MRERPGGGFTAGENLREGGPDFSARVQVIPAFQESGGRRVAGVVNCLDQAIAFLSFFERRDFLIEFLQAPGLAGLPIFRHRFPLRLPFVDPLFQFGVPVIDRGAAGGRHVGEFPLARSEPAA